MYCDNAHSLIEWFLESEIFEAFYNAKWIFCWICVQLFYQLRMSFAKLILVVQLVYKEVMIHKTVNMNNTYEE